MKAYRARTFFLIPILLLGIGLTISPTNQVEAKEQFQNILVKDSKSIPTSTFGNLVTAVSSPSNTPDLSLQFGVETFESTLALPNDGIADVEVVAPDPAEVVSGGQFEVTVQVDEVPAGQNLAGAQFKLGYDPNLLTPLGDPDDSNNPDNPQPGPDFVGDGNATLCVNQFNDLTDEFDNRIGQLSLALACNNGTTDKDNVVLWTIKFQANAATTNTDVALNVIDDEGLILADDAENPAEITSGVPASPTTVTINAVQGVTLGFNPSNATASVNNEFTVDIEVIAGEQPISRVDVSIDFDETLLQVVDCLGCVEAGIQIEPILVDLPTNTTNTVDNTAGTINYSAEKADGPFPTGTFPIAKIHFMAGATEDTTTLDMLDTSVAQILGVDADPITRQDGTVTILTGVQVTINFVLQGSARPPSGWIQPMTVKFFEPGADVLTDAPVATFEDVDSVPNDAGAPTSASVTVLLTSPGTRDITLEGPSTLINVKRSVDASASPTTADLGTLVSGNTNGDTIIDAFDFNQLLGEFFRTDFPPSDLDVNGIVDAFDFNLLLGNFFSVSPVNVP